MFGFGCMDPCSGDIAKNSYCILILRVCFCFRCMFCKVDDVFSYHESLVFGRQGVNAVDQERLFIYFFGYALIK